MTNDTVLTKKLYSIGETAKILGVSVITLRTWEKAGKIYCVKTPLGTRRYTKEELAYILRQGPRKAKKNPSYTPTKLVNPVGVSEKTIDRYKEAGLISKTEKSSDKQFFTIGEASKLLKVSEITLREWERKGKIYCVKTPLGTRRYSKQEISYILRQGPRKRKKPGTFEAPSIAVEIGVSDKSIWRWRKAGLVSGFGDKFFYVAPYQRLLSLKHPWNLIVKYSFGAVSVFLFILSFITYLGQISSHNPKQLFNQFSPFPSLIRLITPKETTFPTDTSQVDHAVLGTTDNPLPIGATGSTGVKPHTSETIFGPTGSTGATGIQGVTSIQKPTIIKESSGSSIQKVKR